MNVLHIAFLVTTLASGIALGVGGTLHVLNRREARAAELPKRTPGQAKNDLEEHWRADAALFDGTLEDEQVEARIDELAGHYEPEPCEVGAWRLWLLTAVPLTDDEVDRQEAFVNDTFRALAQQLGGAA